MTWVEFGLAWLVFVLAVVTDLIVAIYYRSLALGRAGATSVAAMAIAAITTVSALVVIRDSAWFMIPELAGVGVGSYFGCALGRSRD
jgi:hypothetical protein